MIGAFADCTSEIQNPGKGFDQDMSKDPDETERGGKDLGKPPGESSHK